MSLIYNATFDSQTRILSLLDKAGNVISSCEVPSKEPLVDDPNKPLMLRAIADNSSVALNKNGALSNTYQTSTDGTNWTDYTLRTVISLNKGESVYFRCSNHPTTQTVLDYVKFSMTGKIEAWHNAYSMISPLFTSAEGSVGNYGMRRLFYDCKSLTKAPLLLNALSGHCYDDMFDGCEALTKAPDLPATTLSPYCYSDMFVGCKALIKAPDLPATTLSPYCYFEMFIGCKALTKAPDLPATTLSTYCYERMFSGCSSLAEVRIAATTTAEGSLLYWLNGVAATGDVYCDPNATIYPKDSMSGIPSGWNRFVLGAEDTGTTVTMYHNGSAETVRVGTSSYGTCYSAQGWEGFKTLAHMHEVGYTFGAQTPLTMYLYDSTVSAYSVDANAEDGSTETLYDVGDGNGYLTIAQQNANGYNLTSTPFTGLTLTATADNSSVQLTKNGILSNTYKVSTGNGWVDYTFGTVIPLNAGQSCKWICKTHPTTQTVYNRVKFVMTGTIEASGNVNSMLSSGFENITSLYGYDYAFHSLFRGCTSLTQAPQLPATILAQYCYSYMFSECSSLTQAPQLPATILAQYCYSYMFSKCSSLKEVRIAATTTATNALTDWLSNVSVIGDFYCDPNATIFRTGVSGIPSGWTRHALADYPQT